jgi:hypothetical protein
MAWWKDLIDASGGDALKQRQPIKHDGTRFETCQEREDFIKDFVYRYNHTRQSWGKLASLIL